MIKKTESSLEIAGKKLTLEVGELALQATSSVLARLGDSMVLVTVVEGKERTDIDYFPLTVEYVERLYAGGRIKGSRWVKREGRPSDDSILIARLIDRSIRPLFPKTFKKEVQIVVTVLSVDGDNEPDTLSIIATSAALAISQIPWKGPVGAVRMGIVKEKAPSTGLEPKFLVNPGLAEKELSELDLVVSSIKEKVLMMEADALQVKEELVLKAIEKAQNENEKIIAFIEDFVKKVGTPKETVSEDPVFQELLQKLEKSYQKEIIDLIKTRVSKESSGGSEELIDAISQNQELANPDNKIDKKMIAKAVENILFKNIRENTLKGKRPDGRGIDEIRTISSKVGVLPRTHGSAIFQRGDTQALTVVTLGSPRLEQLIESAEGEESKRYIHHYSMPPYSVGETGRIGTPTRREIGHGALAERAIIAVIPKQEQFPYTIRVVSEILSSNGSTSMASTCGSTLALMDAGVPIQKAVAGIAMGLVTKGEEYVILTDILGLEDFSGDMDFKIAGTDDGITAIQLDVKILGLSIKQIREILEKAKTARLFILEKMLATIPESRKQVSQYAPKIEQIKIDVEKIGDVIGSGGRTIKSIIAQTGAAVDVEDDGSVTISGTDSEAVNKALEWVKGIVREVQVGEIFEGEVKRILPFGAFVEFLPGKEGMVHVSNMSTEFVKNPNDVVSIGQKVKVRVAEVDQQGRINLSMLLDASLSGPRRVRREERINENQGETHPLTRQFRRERGESQGGRWQQNKGPRFRKSHY